MWPRKVLEEKKAILGGAGMTAKGPRYQPLAVLPSILCGARTPLGL